MRVEGRACAHIYMYVNVCMYVCEYIQILTATTSWISQYVCIYVCAHDRARVCACE